MKLSRDIIREALQSEKLYRRKYAVMYRRMYAGCTGENTLDCTGALTLFAQAKIRFNVQANVRCNAHEVGVLGEKVSDRRTMIGFIVGGAALVF